MTPGRHLIVNADDFGLSPGVNRGIIEACEGGIVTSAETGQTSRPEIWAGGDIVRGAATVISAMGQAISRNTHLLSLNLNYTTAGPCTPMCLFETSASVTAAVTAGLSIESLGVATNKHEDRTTPVEPRISAEVGHAVAGMKLTDANELVTKLLGKYESKLKEPPLGKSLYECWDPETRRPSKEYKGVIKAYKRSLADMGLELRPEA